MKIINGLVIIGSLALGKDQKSNYCNIDDLQLPAHAEKWDCTGATDNFAPVGSKCDLKCDVGYIQTICRLIFKNFSWVFCR